MSDRISPIPRFVSEARARICVEMYTAIVKLRPEWASGANDDDTVAAVYDRRTTEDGAHRAPLQRSCVAKIVMTGSARTT